MTITEGNLIILWAFLSTIAGCLLILVMINVIQLTRLLLQALRRKKSTGGKL